MGGVVNCVAGCMVATDIIIRTAPRGSGGGAKYPEPHCFAQRSHFHWENPLLMHVDGFALSIVHRTQLFAQTQSSSLGETHF